VKPAVRLALLVPRFAPALQPLAEDPAVGETSSIPTPYPPDGAATFIAQTMARRTRGEEYAFAILLGDELVGTCGLASVKDRAAEMGYWVGRPFWGRGVATEAARLALKYAFARLRLEEVFAHTLVRNEASSRVLTKIGMRHVGGGTMPRSKWPTEPVARFAITRAEWRALADGPKARSVRR
jgi:RimJ/RimL family protein N-acetyltransferase